MITSSSIGGHPVTKSFLDNILLTNVITPSINLRSSGIYQVGNSRVNNLRSGEFITEKINSIEDLYTTLNRLVDNRLPAQISNLGQDIWVIPIPHDPDLSAEGNPDKLIYTSVKIVYKDDLGNLYIDTIHFDGRNFFNGGNGNKMVITSLTIAWFIPEYSDEQFSGLPVRIAIRPINDMYPLKYEMT